MTVAAVLLVYIMATLAIGPRVLVWITAGGGAPRLAIGAWLTAVVTVLGCSIAVVALLLVEAAGHWHFDGPDAILVSCFEHLRAIAGGHAGWLAQIVAVATVAVGVASLIAMCLRFGKSLSRMRQHTFRHANDVRVVGRTIGRDLVVIDAPEPAAYCVLGRPPVIVVTSAALTALDHAQLAAVLAHERAHLGGRHTYLIAAVRGLAAALPRIRLFSEAAMHISCLLEMCADDSAARLHGRQPLLDGMVALAGANAPGHGLAAAGIAVLARAERLSDPPTGFARLRACLGGASAIATMAATPTAVVALSATGALICFA